MDTILDFVFSDLNLAGRVLRQLPYMRDVVALSLTSHFFHSRIQSLMCVYVDREHRIFSDILIQTMYKSYVNTPLLSIQDCHLYQESERACLFRNYLASASPRIGLDLDNLNVRFQKEYGHAFNRFMNYTREHFLALMPFINPNASLLQLRAEFCKSGDNFKLLLLADNPIKLLEQAHRQNMKQAVAIKETTRKIQELCDSLAKIGLGENNNNKKKQITLEPYDSTALMVKVNSTNPDQGVLCVPFTYNPWEKALEPRLMVRRGLRLLPNNNSIKV